MQMHERLSQLPEQELAKLTRGRIEALAKRSAFAFVIDPTGAAVAAYLSVHNLSLYRKREGDTIISAIFHEPAGFSLGAGSVSFISVIPDPIDSAQYIRAGSGERHFFLTNGLDKTRFVAPGELTNEYEYEVQYPDPPKTELVMAVSEDPESFVTVLQSPEEESPSQNLLREQAIAKAAVAAARKHNEDELINRPLSKRSAQEVEESRKRLVELNRRLDGINMEEELIPPPSRS